MRREKRKKVPGGAEHQQCIDRDSRKAAGLQEAMPSAGPGWQCLAGNAEGYGRKKVPEVNGLLVGHGFS